MMEGSSVPSNHEMGDDSPDMSSLKEPQPKPQRSLLFNDIRFFIFCYCISNLLSNTVIVYVVSQITALEREFHLSSSQTGFLVSSMDLGVFTTTIVVGYFANKVHIPKILAITTLVFGITALDSSLPHFIFGPGDADYSNDSVIEGNLSPIREHLCQDSNVSVREQCSEADHQDVQTEAIEGTISFWMVVMGCILNGVALSPRYPFFVTFVESNTDKSRSGFFIGK
ncbi:hypothetical protein LOTGIDRAFT_227443 [Lottia gigantea]|uniref:Major facilitator superfamily (MFS) profile domain-containing protein n=1 Tax=Lottia gigantea TaxID=225164 RepID=V3ZPW4_LOTGI|nr:hypothetical protein LOTGIDRAFT_227443 [Lottia gigantea]ESO93423.1 hypothetical protein LOTGIDRAFT_227443 [Lottia gigantea]